MGAVFGRGYFLEYLLDGSLWIDQVSCAVNTILFFPEAFLRPQT